MANIKNQNEPIPPGDELKIIQQMIEKTKSDTAESGGSLLLWGWTTLAACACLYALVFAGLSRLAWLPWTILMPLAAIIEIIKIFKKQKKIKILTYSQHALSGLWIACGISMFMLAFLALPLGAISYKFIIPGIAMFVAVAMYSTGQIVEWKLLKFSALIWWLSAVVSMLIQWHYQTMVFAAAVILGYLVPGYILRYQYLRKTNGNIC
jgi:hypothetical protein